MSGVVGIKAIAGPLYEGIVGQVGVMMIAGALYDPLRGTVGLAPITGQIGAVMAEPELGNYPYWPVGYWAVGNPYWPVGHWTE